MQAGHNILLAISYAVWTLLYLRVVAEGDVGPISDRFELKNLGIGI